MKIYKVNDFEYILMNPKVYVLKYMLLNYRHHTSGIFNIFGISETGLFLDESI